MTQHQGSRSSPASGTSAKLSSRSLFAFLVNIGAFFVYLFGLAGPLTPANGLPSAWLILLFVGGPIVLLLGASRLYTSVTARVLCYFEVVLIGGAAAYWFLFLEGIVR